MTDVLKWIELAKLRRFQPKMQMRLEYKNLEIKTVDSWEELREALQLRFEVFLREGLGKHRFGYDVDRYDNLGDHLIIRDRLSGKLVGTYRLLCSEFTRDFYSASEFDLQELFDETPGTVLELGRACIHKDYRKGMTLHLLWKGIAHYAQMVGAQRLFGCASVKVTTPLETARVLRSLELMECHSDEFHIRPNHKYHMEGVESILENLRQCGEQVSAGLPTLVLSYLAAGARVYGRPAYDREFKCIDLLTVLDLHKLTARHRQKYFSESRSQLVPTPEVSLRLA